jgi:hypothetical protein
MGFFSQNKESKNSAMIGINLFIIYIFYGLEKKTQYQYVPYGQLVVMALAQDSEIFEARVKRLLIHFFLSYTSNSPLTFAKPITFSRVW